VSAPTVGVITNSPREAGSGGSVSAMRYVSVVPTSEEIRWSTALLSPTWAISEALSSDGASTIGDEALSTW